MMQGKHTSVIRKFDGTDKILRLNALPEERFRSSSGVKLEDDSGWRDLRLKALRRDDYTCYYCGFKSMKYMEVHHMDGMWQSDNTNDLVTLCPLCHSCCHIGLSGIKEKGELIMLSQKCDQAKLNRLILDTVSRYKGTSEEAVRIIREGLPVDHELGSEGLVRLADIILQEYRENGSITPDEDSLKFIYFPNINKYNITEYLIKKGDSYGE